MVRTLLITILACSNLLLVSPLTATEPYVYYQKPVTIYVIPTTPPEFPGTPPMPPIMPPSVRTYTVILSVFTEHDATQWFEVAFSYQFEDGSVKEYSALIKRNPDLAAASYTGIAIGKVKPIHLRALRVTELAGNPLDFVLD